MAVFFRTGGSWVEMAGESSLKTTILVLLSSRLEKVAGTHVSGVSQAMREWMQSDRCI